MAPAIMAARATAIRVEGDRSESRPPDCPGGIGGGSRNRPTGSPAPFVPCSNSNSPAATQPTRSAASDTTSAEISSGQATSSRPAAVTTPNGPAGAPRPAPESSHRPIIVSTRGSGSAKAPAARATAIASPKPTAAPPASSGSSMSTRPFSSIARQWLNGRRPSSTALKTSSIDAASNRRTAVSMRSCLISLIAASVPGRRCRGGSPSRRPGSCTRAPPG